MMQHKQFNSLVVDTLMSNESQIPIKEYPVDYDGLDDRWYYLEKAGYKDSLKYLYGLLGAKECFKSAPGIFFKKNLNRFSALLHR